MDELRERLTSTVSNSRGKTSDVVADLILAEIGRTHAVVPKEPTEAMSIAGIEAATACIARAHEQMRPPKNELAKAIRLGAVTRHSNETDAAYRAMLAAATPPASTGGGEGG